MNVPARPIIAWSYSALSTFENCPRKYWATRVAKVVSDVNQYNTAGDADHQAIENYMRAGFQLPEHLRGLTPLFDKLRSAPGESHVEYKMTLKQDLTKTHGKDWNGAWVRGAGDYIKINGSLATYIDWKSGKPRDEVEDQINLTSLLIFQHFEQVQKVNGALYYYNHQKMSRPHSVLRTDAPRLWNSFISRVKEMEQAKLHDNWPTQDNPLCGWCPYTQCPFNKQEERLRREAAKNRG